MGGVWWHTPVLPTQEHRQEDCWSPGVQGQPGQHSNTSALKKQHKVSVSLQSSGEFYHPNKVASGMWNSTEAFVSAFCIFKMLALLQEYV
jgi:hypothetical protein